MINKLKNESSVLDPIAIAVIISGLILIGLVLYPAGGEAQTLIKINSRLELGDRGNDVATLQTFLASNYLVYPQGLIACYFGPLTQFYTTV